MAWSQKDKKRVAGVIRRVAKQYGSLAGLASKMGLKDRAVLTNWVKRGQVPLDHINSFLALVPEDVSITAKDLHRQGHLVKVEGVSDAN